MLGRRARRRDMKIRFDADDLNVRVPYEKFPEMPGDLRQLLDKHHPLHVFECIDERCATTVPASATRPALVTNSAPRRRVTPYQYDSG